MIENFFRKVAATSRDVALWAVPITVGLVLASIIWPDFGTAMHQILVDLRLL